MRANQRRLEIGETLLQWLHSFLDEWGDQVVPWDGEAAVAWEISIPPSSVSPHVQGSG
jgi:hypothetical protein